MSKNWVVLGLLVSSMFLGIDTAHADDKSAACDSAKPQDMLECATGKFQKEDEKLNGLYQKLRLKAGHGTNAERALIKAQKAWLAFRDATCQYEELAYEDGPLYGALALACQADLTRQRNKQLESYLSCTSNDCP